MGSYHIQHASHGPISMNATPHHHGARKVSWKTAQPNNPDAIRLDALFAAVAKTELVSPSAR